MKQGNDSIGFHRPNTTLDHIHYEFGKTKPPLKQAKIKLMESSKIADNISPFNQRFPEQAKQNFQSFINYQNTQHLGEEHFVVSNRGAAHGRNFDLTKSYDLKS